MTTCSADPSEKASGDSEVYLFSPEKLKLLSKWDQLEKKLAEKNVKARPLKHSDFKNGYLELLSVLTTVGDISKSQYEERFNQMKRSNEVEEHYVIVVIEELASGKIVAASTLFLELKFIHECAMRGRLEDVAVLEAYRGQQLGELVVKIIVELAREVYKCYKLSLDCKDKLIKFYAKNDFNYDSNMLCIRF